MSIRGSEALADIVRVGARIAAPAFIVFIGLLAGSFLLDPPPSTASLDTFERDGGILDDPPAYLTYRSTVLATDRPSIVLTGASNVLIGFRPEELARHLPAYQIHNLALGGSSVTGMATAVELTYANRPPETRPGLVFVAGLWFGSFLHQESVPEATPLAQQMLRFGLFEPDREGYRRTLSPAMFDLAVDALRPFFLMGRTLGANGLLAQHLGLSSTVPPSEISPSTACSAEFEARLAAEEIPFRDRSLPTSQFETLVSLAERVEKAGGTLVLVDMPLPRCFTSRSALWRIYQEQKGAWLADATAHGARYIDMQDLDNDADFADATHPRRTTTAAWAERLAGALKNVLGASRHAGLGRTN